jgi:hypothetical protein
VFLAQQHLPVQQQQSLAHEHLPEQQEQSLAQEHLPEQHLQSFGQEQGCLAQHLVSQQADPLPHETEMQVVADVGFVQETGHGMVEQGIEPQDPPQELAAAQDGAGQVPQAVGFS